MRRTLLSLVFLLGGIACASAQGLTTITTKDAAGVTRTFNVVQDASSQFSATSVICDKDVGAGTTTCANVANGALDINVTNPTLAATQSGTWTVTGAGGTFPIVTWAGGTLGAMANFGSTPGAVLVPSANVHVINAAAAITPADNLAVPTTAVPVINFNMLYDGATMDIARGTSTAGAWMNLKAIADTALGTPTNFGTTPGAVIVGSTNASLFSGTTAIPSGSGTATGALRVELPTNGTGVVGLNAGEAHVGEVGGNTIPITVAMTTSANAIIAGESVGGIQTLANAVRVSGSLGAAGTSGIIQDVIVSFKDVTTATALEVWFFNAALAGATCADNTNFTLADADRVKVVAIVPLTSEQGTTTATTAPTFLYASNAARTFSLASSTSLLACVVNRGASLTPVDASGASLRVSIMRQ